MHMLKKRFAGTQAHAANNKTIDPEFDVMKNNFDKLSETLFKLRDHVNSYIQSTYGVCSNANMAALEFHALLTDSASSHEYTTLAQEMKSGHAILQGEAESALAADMSSNVMKPLEQSIEQQKDIKAKITARANMLQEVDYYAQKVANIKEEKDKAMSSGKDFSAKDNERYERNIKKL